MLRINLFTRGSRIQRAISAANMIALAFMMVLLGLPPVAFDRMVAPAGAAVTMPSGPDLNTPMTNGDVLAITTGSDGTTYIGGNFTRLRTYVGAGASINTTSGTPTVSQSKANGSVYAVVTDGSGGWYIGGSFTKVGNLTRNNLAHVLADGALDLNWDPNANNTVRAMVATSSTVYAGGDFTNIGGQGRNRIAALDSSGSATPWDPNANNTVRALVATSSTVYTGGDFTNIGGQGRNRIAALDTSGSATAWDPNANNTVRALVATSSTVYAGGDFTNIGGQGRNRIAALDTSGSATAWDANADNRVQTLAVSGTTVYAGGDFTKIGGAWRNFISALDTSGVATAWNPIADAGVRALAVSGSTVYAGGDFNVIGGPTRNFIAAIDINGVATSWDPDADNSVYALAVTGSTVYAGGVFKTLNNEFRNNLAAFDYNGKVAAWSPNADNQVRALAISGTTVYAGGDFKNVGGQARNRIAALAATPDTTGSATPWDPNADNRIQALAVSGTTVYAGGDFGKIGGAWRNFIAAIDTSGIATAWNPDADNRVRALAVSGSTVYAGGDFNVIGGPTRNFIAALDKNGVATSWDPNANNRIRALAIGGSAVYVGGDFTNVGGQGRNRIAALNAAGAATAWNPNSDNRVSALAVSNGTVFAGGDFTNIGGGGRNFIAALDTSGALISWNPNADNSVRALAVNNAIAAIGGLFSNINGEPLSFFERYVFPDSEPPIDPTLSSPSHATDTPSNNNKIKIEWPAVGSPGGAFDATSGVDGYSFRWSRDATTLPDQVKDLEEADTSATSQALADGAWWFNLRTKDYAGNWTSTAHLGPFNIDTTKPTGAISINAGAAYTNSAAVILSLSATDGPGSGVAQMRLAETPASLAAASYVLSTPTTAFAVTPVDGNKKVYVQYIDGAGNESIPASDTIVLDTVAPATRVATPRLASDISKTTKFNVNWSATDASPSAGIASYEAQYKIGKSGIWMPWKAGTGAVYASFTGILGKTYYFRAKGTDRAGNVGAWSGEKTTIVPFDNDASIKSRTGFGAVFKKTGSQYYGGTVRYSTTAGEKIAYKVTGTAVYLVSTKAAYGSKAKIYIDNKYVKTIDTYSAKTGYRKVVFSSSLKVGAHTLTVVNVGNRTRLDIDGLGIGG